ncbi:MAG: hypothetical protein ACI8ZH_000818, partial [Flavobacteriales bacterium]
CISTSFERPERIGKSAIFKGYLHDVKIKK